MISSNLLSKLFHNNQINKPQNQNQYQNLHFKMFAYYLNFLAVNYSAKIHA